MLIGAEVPFHQRGARQGTGEVVQKRLSAWPGQAAGVTGLRGRPAWRPALCPLRSVRREGHGRPAQHVGPRPRGSPTPGLRCAGSARGEARGLQPLPAQGPEVTHRHCCYRMLSCQNNRRWRPRLRCGGSCVFPAPVWRSRPGTAQLPCTSRYPRGWAPSPPRNRPWGGLWQVPCKHRAWEVSPSVTQLNEPQDTLFKVLDIFEYIYI